MASIPPSHSRPHPEFMYLVRDMKIHINELAGLLATLKAQSSHSMATAQSDCAVSKSLSDVSAEVDKSDQDALSDLIMAPSRNTLLDLPRELRDMVYDHLLRDLTPEIEYTFHGRAYAKCEDEDDYRYGEELYDEPSINYTVLRTARNTTHRHNLLLSSHQLYAEYKEAIKERDLIRHTYIIHHTSDFENFARSAIALADSEHVRCLRIIIESVGKYSTLRPNDRFLNCTMVSTKWSFQDLASCLPNVHELEVGWVMGGDEKMLNHEKLKKSILRMTKKRLKDAFKGVHVHHFEAEVLRLGGPVNVHFVKVELRRTSNGEAVPSRS